MVVVEGQNLWVCLRVNLYWCGGAAIVIVVVERKLV